LKKPRVARPEEVRITKGINEAIIEFVEPGTSSTNLVIGPEVAQMTDLEILDMYNDVVRAQERAIVEYEHVAVEIPPGRPQIRYFARGDQWVPRGDVLRCYVTGSSPDDEAVTIRGYQRAHSLLCCGP